MSDKKTETTKKDFIILLKSLPAGIPYVGSAYSQFIAEKGSEEIKMLLEDLRSSNETQINELTEKYQIDHKNFNEATEELGKLLAEINKTEKAEINKIEKIDVVIPTGGKGESMFPITSMIPKCLIPIREKPLLLHIIDSFMEYRSLFNKIHVITCENSSAIEYALNQDRYAGFVECQRIDKNVPGALLDINFKIANKPFLVHYNDILIDKINWGDVLDTYFWLKKQKAIIGMVLCSRYYPLGIGVVREGQNNLIKSFEEKPDRLIDFFANIGVAIFEPGFLQYVKSDDEGIFENSVKRVVEDRKNIGMYKVENKWYHVHDLKDYRFVQSEYGNF